MKKHPIISSIADIQNPDRGIGHKGDLLYDFPEDKKFFQETTSHAPGEPSIVLMGRKTWESIPLKYRPLKNRDTLVISSNYLEIMEKFPGVYGKDDPEAALTWAKQYYPRIWIAGGGKVYKKLLHHCEYLYLTEVQGSLPADCFFPDFMNEFTFKKLLAKGTSLNRAPGTIAIPVPYKIKLYERNA